MSKIRKDYSGQKFGKLTVLEFKGYASIRNKDSLWLCRCECGETTTTRIRTLRNGNTKTCGKCPRPKGNQHPCWRGCGEISKDLFNSYRNSATARNLEFNVTIEHMWEVFLKQERRCALTGWDIYFPPTYRRKTEKTASPDRIDNSKGYIPGNIQWIHQDVNYIKSDLDSEYFLKICKDIAKNLKNG